MWAQTQMASSDLEVTLLIPLGKWIPCIWPIRFVVNLYYTHQEQWVSVVMPRDQLQIFAIATVRGTDRSIKPNIRVFDGGRKPEHLQETHAGTGRTCKLHTEMTWIQTQDLLAVRQQW